MIPVDLDMTAAEKKLDAFEERLNEIEERVKDFGASTGQSGQAFDGLTLEGKKDDAGGSQLLPLPGRERIDPAVGDDPRKELAIYRFDRHGGGMRTSDLMDLLTKDESRILTQILAQINEKMDALLAKMGDE